MKNQNLNKSFHQCCFSTQTYKSRKLRNNEIKIKNYQYIYEVVIKSINKSTKFVKCNFKDHIICQRLLPFHKDSLSLAFKFLRCTVL